MTNAKLFVADFDPAQVSHMRANSLCLCYHSLTAALVRFPNPLHPGKDVGDRTVFVIAAPAFPDFLRELGAISDGPSQAGRVRIPWASPWPSVTPSAGSPHPLITPGSLAGPASVLRLPSIECEKAVLLGFR